MEEEDINVLTQAATTCFLFPVLGSRSVKVYTVMITVAWSQITFSESAAAVSFYSTRAACPIYTLDSDDIIDIITAHFIP